MQTDNGVAKDKRHNPQTAVRRMAQLIIRAMASGAPGAAFEIPRSPYVTYQQLVPEARSGRVGAHDRIGCPDGETNPDNTSACPGGADIGDPIHAA